MKILLGAEPPSNKVILLFLKRTVNTQTNMYTPIRRKLCDQEFFIICIVGVVIGGILYVSSQDNINSPVTQLFKESLFIANGSFIEYRLPYLKENTIVTVEFKSNKGSITGYLTSDKHINKYGFNGKITDELTTEYFKKEIKSGDENHLIQGIIPYLLLRNTWSEEIQVELEILTRSDVWFMNAHIAGIVLVFTSIVTFIVAIIGEIRNLSRGKK